MRAKADVWFGYLSTPKYVEQLAPPNVTAGAKLAGCDPDTLDLAWEKLFHEAMSKFEDALQLQSNSIFGVVQTGLPQLQSVRSSCYGLAGCARCSARRAWLAAIAAEDNGMGRNRRVRTISS